ncbi:hypothetical protein GCM10009798_03600 [Nocardioides panacihumi]|uniref:Peptidase C39-like domain-containing protein n=1 Tax=Nocardioides panacihumi TaxID=400774 RepID=A0ABN2Q9L4_9ACTN
MSHLVHRLVGAFVGAVSVSTFAVVGTAGAQAATATCPIDQVTEQGTCAPLVPEPPPTDFQKKQAAEKAAAAGGLATTMSTNDPGGGPDAYVLPEVKAMRIFKEGEGNGKKSYTCGPAATRNMVAAMYKRRTGAYKDFGEAQFATWEKTTTAGTSRANVARALNAHFSSFGHWTTSRPTSKASLLTTVKSDTSVYHQPVIANIDTGYLEEFWGKNLPHFDLIYGYDATGATTFLKFAEEWDPIYIYGASTYGNPYGHQKATLQHAFTAITHTAIHGIVS